MLFCGSSSILAITLHQLWGLALFVVGTAGHVDHGKSTLVRALTGIDPDRLQEEKDRGMTIDLGFAWFTLPGGKEISIVDVPGHERFVNNMLAGVGGIDIAMLVVAADEAVMPQTREHLAILDLLGVETGIIALTKKDLVDEDWLQLVTIDVEELVKGTLLENSSIYAVSAETGEGLEELVESMDRMLINSQVKRDIGRPRLPIDRVFTVSGFGTVVTGTLIDGSLRAGQDVILAPSGNKARIRGLQTHKRIETVAEPGTRVAANISGIDQNEIMRGEVLTSPGWLRSSEAFDVRLKVLPEAPKELRHNMFVTLHTGSSETVTKLRLLEGDVLEPGVSGWAQMKPESPLPVVKGDYFVIRSNMTTLGGGSVVEPHAKRHRRRHKPTLQRLETLELGTSEDIVFNTIESSGLTLIDVEFVVNLTNIEKPTVIAELSKLVSSHRIVATSDQLEIAKFFSENHWANLRGSVLAWLKEFHAKFPLRGGVPREELRSRFALANTVYNDVIVMLVSEGVIKEQSSLVALETHVCSLSKDQEIEAQRYVGILNANPFAPPTNQDLDQEIINYLIESGKVVRVSDGVIFAAESYDSMLDKVRTHIRLNGEISIADVRDMFSTSRKYSLALMDHMDQQQITRRVGDVRILR